MIAIRRAVPADAPAMSEVLIASITELCTADHHDDVAVLGRWLANKTPEGIGKWFANPANTLLLAERDGEAAAVGGYNTDRTIILNYVSPRHRFAGVSKAMLAALEAGLGAGEARLDSTHTARPFYLAAGWEELGPTGPCGVVPGYRMRKTLG